MSRKAEATYVTARLGSRFRTVLPKAVREPLRVGPGDDIGFAIRRSRVTVTAVRTPQPPDNPLACFDEWASEADTQGYASL